MVIILIILGIFRLYVCCFLVVYWVGVISVIFYMVSLFVVGQFMVIFVGMNCLLLVEVFLCVDFYEVVNMFVFFFMMYLGREKRLEVVILQVVVLEIKIFYGKSGVWYLVNLDILVFFLLGMLVLLVYGSICGYFEGDIIVEYFKDILVVGKYFFYVFCVLVVLYFVIYVEYIQFFIGCMYVDIIYV